MLELKNGTTVRIRPGEERDRLAYLQICQRAAESAYSHPLVDVHGLFSAEHFFHAANLADWQAGLINDSTNRWWVAQLETGDKPVVGGIQLGLGRRFEGSGFYVEPAWQGQGIGRALWLKRQKQVTGPLFFEVFSHADKTIARHEHRGATRTGRQRLIHWDSWPAGINLTAWEYVIV